MRSTKILIAIVVLTLLSATNDLKTYASNKNAVPKQLTFVYVHPESSPKTQWLIKIYTEALKRMGISFNYYNVPSKRASLFSSKGIVDGELNRIEYYGDIYPNMVQVPEPNQKIRFTAFTASKKLNALSVERLKNAKISIGYIRGLVNMEKDLPQQFTKARFAPLRDTAHGITMLTKRRIDVFIANQGLTTNMLKLKNNTQIYQNKNYGYTHTFYAWLNKKHAHLASPLAEILRQMKREGLFELYKNEVNYHNIY